MMAPLLADQEYPMHIDAPKGSVTSFRDFIGKYAMFVVSILTALGFEQAGQLWYHTKLANEASAKIVSELRANVDELRSIHKKNAEQLKILERVTKLLAVDLKAGQPDAAILKHLHEDTKGQLGMNMVTPTLRRDAWEVAVANQSASYMPADTLHRYSLAYTNLRDAQQAWPMLLQFSMDGPGAVNIMSDLETGKGDARAVFHVLQQMKGAIREIESNGDRLEKDLETALKAS
jgi:hypothetical protein